MGDQVTIPQRDGPQATPLDAPSAYAYPFPRRVEGLLPWSHASERLERARNYWLATARPDGRPHVTPLWGVWLDGALFFDGLPTTRWGRNLAANPAAAVHLASGDDVVILEGRVQDFTTDGDLAARIVAAWDAKYGRLTPEPATHGLFRLLPLTARAWSSNTLEDGTRWQFPAEGR